MNLKKLAALLTVPFFAVNSLFISANADSDVSLINLKSSISTEQSCTVDLSWNSLGDGHEMYSYQLFRKKDGGEWESRSIWDGKETVNVLNVYPDQPYLKNWMTTTLAESEDPAGMGLFNIDSVHIDQFNADPAAYMLDQDGNWKYNVLFFGSSDCNSYRDLNANSYDYVQRYVDSGRGVLFGHDTICSNFGHSYFCKFADQLGILVKIDRTVNPTTSVSVVNIGTLTNFPWNIRGTLNIPSCHSYGQYVGGTLKGKEWMTLNTTQLTDNETGAHSNFYLVTYGNLGMIQTGHSNGQATDDERKVLANTLFYLHQISQKTEAKDNSFYDEAAPNMPSALISGISNGDAKLSLNSSDNGTKYEYYISASSDTNQEQTVESNIVSQTALSGIKGYVYDINKNSKPMPELVTYDENNEIVQNVVKADSNGKISVPVENFYKDGNYYIHAYAVDNENNVSKELIIPLNDKSIEEPVVTTTTTTTASVTSTTTASKTASTTTASSDTKTASTTKKAADTNKSEKSQAATTVKQSDGSAPKTGGGYIPAYLLIIPAITALGITAASYKKKK